MNKMKSLFIGTYPMFAMGLGMYGIDQLVTSGMSFIWLGAVLVGMPIMMFISRVMMLKDMPRTSAHFPLITLLAIVGVVLAGYQAIPLMTADKLSQLDQIGFILTVVGFVLYMIYNFWYSSLGRGSHALLAKGKSLPLFSLTGSDGKVVNSDSFKGAPTVLIFFRGNWCPLCMAQIKEVAANYRELAASGAKIAFISPQPEKNTQALAAKFDVPFQFLTDVGGNAAKALGIHMKNGLPAGMEMLGYDKDTVYPTVIITNADGKIIYNDFTDNYRVRPEPQEFIKVLNSQGA